MASPPRGSGMPMKHGTPGHRSENDAAVQGTNDDACLSKMSCVKLGYLQDEFLSYFVKKPALRAPLINRGYYSRVKALHGLLDQFLAAGGPDVQKQVVVLGAGFDTAFFRLHKEGRAPHLYIEVDFMEVVTKKAAIIARHAAFHPCLGEEGAKAVKAALGEVHAPHYKLLRGDLRDLAGLEAKLAEAGLDWDKPCLLLSECVLIYMPPERSAALIQWASRLSTAAFVVYEQIMPGDPFGRRMVDNLQSRGCPLLGIWDTPDLAAQQQRFLHGGWSRAGALTMDEIYQHHLDPVEKARAERLEIFDEFEEWHLIQEHYCVAWGVNDKLGILESFGFASGEGTPAACVPSATTQHPPPLAYID